MFDFISQLTESRLFPTAKDLDKVKHTDINEWLLINLCALRIMLLEEHTCDWARVYARKTAKYNNFSKWKTDGTDLYYLLYSDENLDPHDKASYGLSKQNVINWLRLSARDDSSETATRRLFVKLDYDLKIHNSALKSIKRLALDWPSLDIKKKKLVVNRILFFFRQHMKKSEILIHLERLVKNHGLETKQENPDGVIYD